MKMQNFCTPIGVSALALCCSLMINTAHASDVRFARVVIEYPHDECSFRYSPVDFCDERHVNQYNAALASLSANFSDHYILIPITEWADGDERSLVAIDKNTGVVYPVPIDSFFAYSGGKRKGRKATLSFAKSENKVCINGSILVYRATETGKFCFSLEGEKFVGYHTTYMGHDKP